MEQYKPGNPKKFTPIGIIVDKSNATEEFIDDNYTKYPKNIGYDPSPEMTWGEIKEIEAGLKEKKNLGTLFS